MPTCIAAIAIACILVWQIRKSNLDSYNESYHKIENIISAKEYEKAISEIFNLNQEYSNSIGVTTAIENSKSILPDLIESHVKQLTDDGNFDEAVEWLISKKDQFSTEIVLSEYINGQLSKVLKEKSTIVNIEFSNLLFNIKNNNGHLNENGKQLLKKLLKIEPDNYWLNFLASKEL